MIIKNKRYCSINIKDKKFAEEFDVNIQYFCDEDIENATKRMRAFYISSINTLFINQDLPEQIQDKVKFHEIKHKDHNLFSYKKRATVFETEANRFMIKNLIKKYINETDCDLQYFDWTNFVEYYDLKTMSDESMVLKEFEKYVESLK